MAQTPSLPQKAIQFIKTDIWRIRANKLPKPKLFLIQHLRIFLLALRGFNEDKCQLRASALTFYSLLSVVPVVAMAFGVAKGFGFEQLLEKQIIEKLPGQEEIATQIIGFAQSFLENTKGGLIAGIGIAGLFWTVVKVLGNIENSFNDIWGIKQARSLGRKFSDYLSMMMICPILFIMSSSVTVVITSQITKITEQIAILGFFGPLIFTLLKLLPYCVIWVLFTFIYVFMPNSKVNFKAGIMGGIIAGTIYQLVQWAYITFQIGVSKYGAIYGSFAALPLFLLWLQLSWLIVLFGAEISFAEQNVHTYEFEPDSLKVSPSFKRLLTLQVAHLCVKNFVGGKRPLNAEQISNILEIPIRLVRQVIFELVEANVLTEAKMGEDKNGFYQPARDVGSITIKNVIDALDNRGSDNIPLPETPELEKIKAYFSDLGVAVEKLPSNKLLKDI